MGVGPPPKVFHLTPKDVHWLLVLFVREEVVRPVYKVQVDVFLVKLLKRLLHCSFNIMEFVVEYLGRKEKIRSFDNTLLNRVLNSLTDFFFICIP